MDMRTGVGNWIMHGMPESGTPGRRGREGGSECRTSRTGRAGTRLVLPEELPTIDGHQALAVGEVLKMTPDIDETSCWVVGYVVGYTSRSIHNAVFSTEGAVRSNILLADRKEEDNTARCLPVELDQTALKECLSLADNPGLWKCRIGVYGKVKTYFRVTGLREVGDFEWLEADEPGVLPDPGPDPEPTPDPDPGPEEGTHVKDTLGIDEGGMVIPGGRTARIG